MRSNVKMSRGQIVHIGAFIFAATLLGLAIAIIAITSNAVNLFNAYYPTGLYQWVLPRYRPNLPDEYPQVRFAFNRSTEIKTFLSAAVSLVAGLIGVYAFAFSPKRAINNASRLWCVLPAAATACIVNIICVSWAAVAEVKENDQWCYIDNINPSQTYLCTIEHSACSALRFTTEGRYGPLDHLCHEFQKSRTLMIPMAVFSLVLVGAYAAMGWMGPPLETAEERADRRAALLRAEEGGA